MLGESGATMAIATVHQLEREIPGLESQTEPFVSQPTFGPTLFGWKPFVSQPTFGRTLFAWGLHKDTFGLSSDEQGLSTQEIFEKRVGERAYAANATHEPHVQIIQGEAVVVTHTDNNQCHNSPSEEQILADSTIMTPVPHSYDTYKCNDCDVILTGYKSGTMNLEEHIWKGSARCRYIKAKFRGRENHLIALHGSVRFLKGLVALPQYLLCSNQGYVTVAGRRHCVICSMAETTKYTFGNGHYLGCGSLAETMTQKAKTLALDASGTDGPVFRQAQNGEFKPTRESASWTDCVFQADPANMQHVWGTVEEHNCDACGIRVKDFVENDTLLGEHIYHVYNQGCLCPYIEDRFQGKRANLRLILGYERYRRGQIAFPEALAKNSYGFVEINRRYRCVVCGASADYGTHYTSNQQHRSNCNAIKDCVLMKLRYCKLTM